MTRVISLGLDGAAWHKLDRLMDEGRLPNLEELVDTGVRAPLRTVKPPVTCPAWRCSTSGKNPGKVGVFWWLNLDHETGEIRPPDANSFETADIWDYLSEDGHRCAVVNVPMTFPPSELNGTMVSGFGAPLDDDQNAGSSITYPPEYEREIAKRYGWRTGVEDITTKEGLIDTYEIIESRFELLLDLLERDFEYIHLTIFYINMLQHKYGDAEETNRGWELIDQYLGEIDTEDTLLVIYSDHGHSTIENTFIINRWLIENGYLSLKSKPGDSFTGGFYSMLTALGLSPKKMANLVRQVLPTSIHSHIIPSSYPISTAELAQRVNWEETDAVAFSQGPLYLNRERLGSQYENLRDTLKQNLESLEHRGERILSSVQAAEDVYQGSFVDEAPDLMLTSNDGWEIYGGVVPNTFESQVTSWTSGNHPVGMLTLNGPGVEPKVMEECHILDVAPTILSYLGSPIANDLDGRVLQDAFPNRKMNPKSRTSIEKPPTQDEGQIDGLTKQLRSLGYLE